MAETQQKKIENIELLETNGAKRARIVWRETPAEDLGKPETVREVVTGTSFSEIRENFWKQPAFAPSKMRKVEILKIEWI